MGTGASKDSRERELKESEEKVHNLSKAHGEVQLLHAVTSRNVQDTHHWIKRLKNVNFYDPFGKTPLHRAAFLGDVKIVRLLLQAGADVNMLASSAEPAVQYRSALHEASERGERDHRQIMQLLVRAGVNVGGKDGRGKTALDIMSERGYRAAVHCLLDESRATQRNLEVDLLQLSTNIRLYQPEHHQWLVVPPKIINPNNVTLKLDEEDQLISDIFDFRHIAGELSPDQVCIVKFPHDQVYPDESRRLVAVNVGSKHLTGHPTWEFFFKTEKPKPYVVADLAQLSCFAVLSRPLTDTFTVGSSGGELTSTADPRASVKIPENASNDMKVVLEILPVDESTTKRAQKHEDECKLVQSAGAVLRVKVTGPEGNDESIETSRPVELQLPAPTLLQEQSDGDDDDDDELRILQDSHDNEWNDVTDSLEPKRDRDGGSVKCQVKKLETAGYITIFAKHLQGLAAAFGRVFLHRHIFNVNMLIFYNDENPDNVQLYVGCCLSDKTRGEAKDLKEDGYKMFQRPSKDIFIREGEKFYIEFSGNVKPRDEEGIEDSLWFTFHSKKRNNHTETSVKVVDTTQEPRTNILFKWPSQGEDQAGSGDTKLHKRKTAHDECFLKMEVCLPKEILGPGTASTKREPKMSSANQRLLINNRIEIMNNMQPQEVMDYLIQKWVLDADEVEEIRNTQPTKTKQVAALLDALPYKDDQAFDIFVEVLKETKHGYLAALLQGKAKPDPPTLVKVKSESSKSLNITWTPGSDGGCQQHFEISYSQKGSSNFSMPHEVKPLGVTSYQITGLQESTTYTVRVCGVNDLGPGGYRDAEGTTQAGPTMSMKNQDILRRKRDEVVNKMQPEKVIDHLVKDQVVTAEQATEIRTSLSRRDLIVMALLDLLPFHGDQAYTGLLSALRDTNQPYLAALLCGAEKPDQPAKVMVTFARHDSFDVSWTPGSDGGAEQHFKIICHRKEEDSGLSTSPIEMKKGATSHRIDSLQPQTIYTVKVRGVNVMGEGQYQETEAATRAEPTMSEKCQQILKKHSAALVDKMQPQNVVDYLIQRNAIEAIEGENMQHIDKSSKAVVRRLLECLPYNGDRAFSGLLSFLEETKQGYLSALLRGVEKPDPPSGVTVTCFSHESLDVSWTPGSDGGSIQHFEIVYQKKGNDTTPNTIELKEEGITNYLIDGLEQSTVYVVKVRGVNVLGPGEFQSQDTEAATRAGPTMSKEYQDLLKKARSEAAENMLPEGVISHLINASVLEPAEAKMIRSRKSTNEITCVLLDVLPYKGDEGYGALLTALEETNQNYLAAVCSGKEKPSPPTDVTLISNCYDALNVSWTPGYDGGSEQYFEITYRDKDRDGDFNAPPIEVKTSNVNNHQIEDLQESTAYVVRVRGVNELGPGEYQAQDAEGTTRGAPAHPDFLTIKKRTDSSLTLSWKPGRVEDDPWEDYFLQYKEKASGTSLPFLAPIRVVPQLATEYVIEDLEPDSAYTIKLFAKSASKTSKSVTLTGVTDAKPD